MKKIVFLILIFPSLIFAEIVKGNELRFTQEFIKEMVNKHQFKANELNFIFGQISLEILPAVEKTALPKRKKKIMSWDKYKSLFITDERIKSGVTFWKQNIKLLEKAEKKFNIPSEIIVAILGIETNYGKNQGEHPTLETLLIKASGNNRRKKFYKKELESFLLLVRDNNIPPLSVKGSHAGALGMSQFISSSYRHYAVDFDEDEKIDLFSSNADAIGSIANYFDKHQWHDGGELSYPIKLEPKHFRHVKSSTNKPIKTAQYWKSKGIPISKKINESTKVALIKLPQDNHIDMRQTLWNFYVLTRYNHDNRYAMTAQLLSEHIKKEFEQIN